MHNHTLTVDRPPASTEHHAASNNVDIASRTAYLNGYVLHVRITIFHLVLLVLTSVGTINANHVIGPQGTRAQTKIL